MLLSTIIGKKIYADGKERGVCDGVFLSTKSREIKFLSCRLPSPHQHTVSLAFSQIDYVTNALRLKRFYPRLASGCEKLTLGLPVYDEKGGYFGLTTDAKIERNCLSHLLLEDGRQIPVYAIAAFQDAVILKKAPLFPLSRRIPAHALSYLEEPLRKEKSVVKKALISAAKSGNLIKFTLSLPPFSLHLDGVLSGEL